MTDRQDDDLPPGDRWLTPADVTAHWQAGQLAKALRECQHATRTTWGMDATGRHEGPLNMAMVNAARRLAVDCLSTLGESGESGESQRLARLSEWRKRGEGVANLPPRHRWAVELLDGTPKTNPHTRSQTKTH